MIELFVKREKRGLLGTGLSPILSFSVSILLACSQLLGLEPLFANSQRDVYDGIPHRLEGLHVMQNLACAIALEKELSEKGTLLNQPRDSFLDIIFETREKKRMEVSGEAIRLLKPLFQGIGGQALFASLYLGDSMIQAWTLASLLLSPEELEFSGWRRSPESGSFIMQVRSLFFSKTPFRSPSSSFSSLPSQTSKSISKSLPSPPSREQILPMFKNLEGQILFSLLHGELTGRGNLGFARLIAEEVLSDLELKTLNWTTLEADAQYLLKYRSWFLEPSLEDLHRKVPEISSLRGFPPIKTPIKSFFFNPLGRALFYSIFFHSKPNRHKYPDLERQAENTKEIYLLARQILTPSEMKDFERVFFWMEKKYRLHQDPQRSLPRGDSD